MDTFEHFVKCFILLNFSDQLKQKKNNQTRDAFVINTIKAGKLIINNSFFLK